VTRAALAGLIVRQIANDNRVETPFVCIRKWLDQHVVDDAEHGCCCADAECERQDGNDGETGICAKHARSEDEVAPGIFERCGSPDVPYGFFECRAIAELPLGLSGGLRRSGTGGFERTSAQFRMQAHLFFKLLEASLPLNQKGNAAPEFSKHDRASKQAAECDGSLL
jgi:hypothetical protein